MDWNTNGCHIPIQPCVLIDAQLEIIKAVVQDDIGIPTKHPRVQVALHIYIPKAKEIEARRTSYKNPCPQAAQTTRQYRLYDPQSRKFCLTRDVVFDKNEMHKHQHGSCRRKLHKVRGRK